MELMSVAVALVAVFVLGLFLSPLLRLKINYFQRLSRAVVQSGGTLQFKHFWMRGPFLVVTGDPANIEYTTKTKFDNFPKGKEFSNTLYDVFGDGFFTSDDDLWRKTRMVVSKSFNYSDFRDNTMRTIARLVNCRLLPLLEEACKSGSCIDFQDVMFRLSFDNVSITSFGIDPSFLSRSFPEAPFIKAFHQAMKACMARLALPVFYWKTMKFLGLGHERKLRQAKKILGDFAGPIIENVRDNIRKERIGDLLSIIIMQLRRDQGQDLLVNKVVEEYIVNILLAAADTTPVGLTWFFWLLHEHPHIEENILLEIRRILNRRQNSAEKSDLVFKPEEMKDMHYLHAAVSESLRLYPPVPLDGRVAAEDDVLPDGTKLMKGTKLVYFSYCMGRMKNIWGDDCLEFRPERWLRDGVFVNESEFKFPVFNAGPRRCLGKDMAYWQMKYVAASVISCYRVRVLPGHKVVPDEHGITMSMKHGFFVSVHPR
eukprot:Gb_08147 [translate_table: standard]